jgi:serine/threonine protein kinase
VLQIAVRVLLVESLFMIGKTVLHYRMIEKLGQGGMGEVYRAEDTNLHRLVAIKVLPDEFAHDAERLARFQREAEVLSSLNHPNISTLYGFEESDGKRFIVMELVQGETLSRRLLKGPLSVDESLELCRQIAEGLEAAHEKGVIHRDLKPSNVMITSDEKIKILDFGLAKAFAAESAVVAATQSPTITEAVTRAGTILGTAAYMSPEQAKGKAVDKRADIWAFGCILFECLTGKAPFKGETVTETLAKILEGTPDWNLLPPTTPTRMKELLHRCLQRNPRERLHDIGDVRIEIGESAINHTVPMETMPFPRRISLPWLVAGTFVVLLAGIIIGLLLLRSFQPTPSPSVITSTIKVEQGHWLEGLRRSIESQQPSRTAMAISSDGRFVVYCAIEENPGPQAKPRLYLRRMEQSQAKPITGTEGGISPFLSPDDRYVGFWADGKLKKVPVEGGVATSLCDADPLGASWGRDNSIVFAGGNDAEGLSKVSADGGKPETLTKPDPKREEVSHSLPRWLPGGKAVVFTIKRHGWDPHPWLAVLRLDTSEWHVLLQDAADATYIPTRHLVFLRQGTLMAARFDLAKLEVIGQPVALVEDVTQAFSVNDGYNTVAGQFCISDTGSLVYAAGGIVPEKMNSLVWVDQRGIEQPVTTLQFPFGLPRLSPDGQRIAYITSGREQQVYVYDLARGTNSRLTGEGRADWLTWTPDGKRILFAWQRSLVNNLFWQPYDGSASMERLTTSEYNQYPGSWSSDGHTVAIVESHPGTGADIALLDTRSGRVAPCLNLNSPFREAHPEFSPDGRWIAYTSGLSGRTEVYVQPFPSSGGKWQISNEGGIEPLWSRNGKQLFYRLSGKVLTVDVQTGSGFSASKPHLLFDKPGYGGGLSIRGWDLSPDGQRFLMVKLDVSKPAPINEMILIQNWFEELRRLHSDPKTR